MPPKQKSLFETFLTGDKRLDAKLERLDTRTRKKFTRSALGKAGTIIVKAIKRNTPVGLTKRLKRAIGKSLKKVKQTAGKFFQGMRAGVNVGKKLSRSAPHGHIVVLGTKTRTTKKGKSTGKVVPNDFARKAMKSSMGRANRTIKDTLLQKIQAEANKS